MRVCEVDFATDPCARWTALDGPACIGYYTNYLIDLHAGVILGNQASPAVRNEEVNAAQRMIETVEERFGIKPNRLVGDTAYGSGPCSVG